MYLGVTLREDFVVRTSTNSNYEDDSAPVKAVRYALAHAAKDNIPDTLEVYHSCHCARW